MLTNVDLEESSAKLGIPLRGVFSKDLLPRFVHDGGYIINLQDHDAGSGTHWTAFVVTSSHIHYFDSFGFPLPRSVMRAAAHRHILYNNKHIQNVQSGVCGSYVLAFLWWLTVKRGTLQGFQRLFSDDPEDNRRILQALMAPL
jgi:hypothetical protein